jgi:hypothetical protein
VSAPAAERSGRHVCAGVLRGKARVMAEFSVRAPGGDGRRGQVAAWMGAAVVYGAAQGLSAWAARYAQGRGDQTSVRAVRTAGIRAARRRVPGRVTGAEPEHGDVGMASVARRSGRARGTATAGGPGVVGAGRYRPQRLRAAGIRHPPPLGAHCRLGAAVRCHGTLCIPGPPGRSNCCRAGSSRDRVDRVRDRPERGGRREEQLTGGLALFQLATELPAAVLVLHGRASPGSSKSRPGAAGPAVRRPGLIRRPPAGRNGMCFTRLTIWSSSPR